MKKSQIPDNFNLQLSDVDQKRQKIINGNKKASQPVVKELSKAGYKVEWISDLYNQQYNYKECIPILLKWLPIINNIAVKEEIVRALSVQWARPSAAPLLIHEMKQLRNVESPLKWVIGNALSVVADSTFINDLLDIASDKSYGTSRQMILLALGRLKAMQAEDVLIELLGENGLTGHALTALGKLKSHKALPNIEKYLNHPNSWIRREAKRAMERITSKPSQK